MTAKVVDVGINYAGFTQHTTQAGYPIRLTASGQVLAVPGQLLGFYIANTTAGTLILGDSLTASNPVSGTITPAIGWNEWPGIFQVGIFATIGGTLDVTFFFVK